uniref:Ycf21 n=1 Tax=Thaumatella adunca TaxID=2006976 RepID=A0A1Z1MMS7_9FLOR|nr:hypothetical protein [Thaumatella adunca]ARW67387.1 hypothetical protein [Thaumatella adunca]
MNFYIKKYHSICILPINRIKYLTNKLPESIMIQVKLILINDGSYTRTIQYITSHTTKIKISQKYYKKSVKINRQIRCVWLETSMYTKLTFARSLWTLISNNIYRETIKNKSPIGQSFIENQIDIYKDLHEIYYSYCKDLEKTLKFRDPIWGRKYTLYYKNQSYVTIQEFFSPKIIDFFN